MCAWFILLEDLDREPLERVLEVAEIQMLDNWRAAANVPRRVREGRRGRPCRARSVLVQPISREIRMNYIAHLHEPFIWEVPLSWLLFTPENVRKTSAGPVAEAEI